MPAIQSIDQIFTAVDETLKNFKKGAFGERIAAFDADGTLWDTDIGENFFKYQAENKLVDLPENPWDFYTRWHETQPIPAYLWLAQINKGKKISEVRAWAKAAVDQIGDIPFFPHMVELVKYLQEREVTVYVVTASVKWAVEPAAEILGIDKDHVIGIETQVVDEVITDRGILPITWREGKSIALLQKTGNRAPILAAGNTTGDQYLLECAQGIKFAHTTVPKSNSIYPTEEALLKLAKKNDWHWWQPF